MLAKVDAESLRPPLQFQVNIKIQLNVACVSRLSFRFFVTMPDQIFLASCSSIYSIFWENVYIKKFVVQKLGVFDLKNITFPGLVVAFVSHILSHLLWPGGWHVTEA